jgi:hypothetical protein
LQCVISGPSPTTSSCHVRCWQLSTFSQSVAARVGVSSTALYRHLAAGRVERVARRLYRKASAEPFDPDLLAIAHRLRHATICLTSALYVLERSLPRLTATEHADSFVLKDVVFDVGGSTIHQIRDEDEYQGLRALVPTTLASFTMTFKLDVSTGAPVKPTGVLPRSPARPRRSVQAAAPFRQTRASCLAASATAHRHRQP